MVMIGDVGDDNDVGDDGDDDDDNVDDDGYSKLRAWQ